MRVAVLGASGKVGSQLVTALLASGHSVTAMVHSSKKDLGDNPKLKVICGDVHSKEDVEAAIAGSDVVVSTLGSWGTKTKDIVSSATKNLIPAMNQAGVTRLVSVTGSAAKLPNEKLNFIQSINRAALGLVAGGVLKDAEEHLALLSNSNIKWVSVRSPVMTSSPKNSYLLTTKAPAPWAKICRAAVVEALIDIIEEKAQTTSAPFISSN